MNRISLSINDAIAFAPSAISAEARSTYDAILKHNAGMVDAIFRREALAPHLIPLARNLEKLADDDMFWNALPSYIASNIMEQDFFQDQVEDLEKPGAMGPGEQAEEIRLSMLESSRTELEKSRIGIPREEFRGAFKKIAGLFRQFSIDRNLSDQTTV